MRTVARGLDWFASHPILNVVLGILMLVTGLAEAGETLIEDFRTLNFGAHHGVMIFGLVHAFKALPALVLGAEMLHESRQNGHR